MKIKNARESMVVQVKRDCRGWGGEEVSEGTVAQIRCVDTSDNSVQIHADDIDDGYCWVHVSKVRKYRKEQVTQQAVEQKEKPQELTVGDKVLVGTEGAGFGLVRREYAGLVCTVQGSHRDADVMYISHPGVLGGARYASRVKYLTKVRTEQEHHVFSTGDVVQLLSSHINRHNEALTAGAVYRVLGKGFTHDTVILRVDGYVGSQANVATTEIKLVCKAGDYEDVAQE